MKLWDLETQHCFQTIVGHRSEVLSMELIKGETRLITASGHGGSVKVFSITSPSDEGLQVEEKVIGRCWSHEHIVMGIVY